jgi:hypothetical protein
LKFAGITFAILMVLVVAQATVMAQNLGTAPALNAAVQGQQATQVEGGFLNIVNWFCNVIAPVGDALALGVSVAHWLSGRGFGRWAFGGTALLAVSAITRLAENWIIQGTAGIT